MHEIGTVRASLVLRALQHNRDTVEVSLCMARPYAIFPCRSKNGCWLSCATPGAAACWPPNSDSSASSWSRPRRCAAGCTRWAGCGNGRSWWRDNDPLRVEKLARIRHTLETLEKRAVVLFADELDIHLLPKVGYQWMPQGTTVKLVTPGQNQKHYLAGALELKSGRLVHCTSPRKTTALFRTLLDRLEGLSPSA